MLGRCATASTRQSTQAGAAGLGRGSRSAGPPAAGPGALTSPEAGVTGSPGAAGAAVPPQLGARSPALVAEASRLEVERPRPIPDWGDEARPIRSDWCPTRRTPFVRLAGGNGTMTRGTRSIPHSVTFLGQAAHPWNPCGIDRLAAPSQGPQAFPAPQEVHRPGPLAGLVKGPPSRASPALPIFTQRIAARTKFFTDRTRLPRSRQIHRRRTEAASEQQPRSDGEQLPPPSWPGHGWSGGRRRKTR